MFSKSLESKTRWEKFIDKIDGLHGIDEKYIISFKNKYKYIWDVFIVCIAFYNSVTIPLEMSYEFPW